MICKLTRTIFGQFSFKEFLLLLESFFQIVTARQRLLIMQSKVNLTLFSIAVLLLWWYHPNTTIILSVTFSQWHLNWRAAKLFPTNLRVLKYNLIANTKNISYLSHSWSKTNGLKLTQVTTFTVGQALVINASYLSLKTRWTYSFLACLFFKDIMWLTT